MCLLRGETRKFSVKYKMYSSGFIFNAAIRIYIVAVLLVYLAKKLKKIPIYKRGNTLFLVRNFKNPY